MKSKQAARELGGTSNGKSNRKVIQLADTFGLPPPFPPPFPTNSLTSRCTCALNISFQLKRILRTLRFRPLPSPLSTFFLWQKQMPPHNKTKKKKTKQREMNNGKETWNHAAYNGHTGMIFTCNLKFKGLIENINYVYLNQLS